MSTLNNATIEHFFEYLNKQDPAKSQQIQAVLGDRPLPSLESLNSLEGLEGLKKSENLLNQSLESTHAFLTLLIEFLCTVEPDHATRLYSDIHDLEILQSEIYDSQKIWTWEDSLSLITELIETIKPAADRAEFLTHLLRQAVTLENMGYVAQSVDLGEICLQFDPDNLTYLGTQAGFLQAIQRGHESLDLLDRYLQLAPTECERLAAISMILKGLLQLGGEWEAAQPWCEAYALTMQRVIEELRSSAEVNILSLLKLLTTGVIFPYLEDQPERDRPRRNAFAAAITRVIQGHYHSEVRRYQLGIADRDRQPDRPLRIGYLSNCLREHSVGWLVRWTLRYHDRQNFEIYAYTPNPTQDELQAKFAAEYCPEHFQIVPYSIRETADHIAADHIDILIDLDSLTSNYTCGVMALRPAPLQVGWLGFDASGMPTVDYYLADHHSLPANAQTYYQETIWNLPETYIAIDGFEVGIPDRRRTDLEIPADAIVYYCSQTGYKRHPNNVRDQMEILRQVPDSYFVIKGVNSDRASVEQFFGEMAAAAGVSRDRLRFLPQASSSQVHRANIAIADVVLDTYPYNGTTTTLETMWMGVPIVTQAGQQFASRQGLTLLKNAGVEAGIAYSSVEYIDWGVRLGTDAALRRSVSQQLWRSRRTATLWNGRRFTQQLEAAYRSMWQRWCQA